MTAMRPALALVMTLALAACGDPAEEADDPLVAETPIPVEPDGGIGDGATPLPQARQTEGSGIPEFGIPAAVQGRWGMNANDCDPAQADVAKGLMVVSATTLTFYESLGRLGAIESRADDSIRAKFGFTGEGMEWSNTVTLSLQDGGETLVRRETGEEGSAGPVRYTKCAT